MRKLRTVSLNFMFANELLKGLSNGCIDLLESANKSPQPLCDHG
jgi:hypothetical protein